MVWMELSSGLSHTPIFGTFAPHTGRIEAPENHNAFGWDSNVLVSNRATKPAGGMCGSGGYRIRIGLLETFPEVEGTAARILSTRHSRRQLGQRYSFSSYWWRLQTCSAHFSAHWGPLGSNP